MHARTAVPLESSSPLAAALRRKFARTFACGLLYQTKRVLVAVDEHAPCARLAGIAAESVVEGVANRVGGVLLDARPDSLVRRSWARRFVRLAYRTQLGDDVLHGANVRRDIVDCRTHIVTCGYSGAGTRPSISKQVSINQQASPMGVWITDLPAQTAIRDHQASPSTTPTATSIGCWRFRSCARSSCQ